MVNHDTSSDMLYLQSMYADKFSEFLHPYKVLKIPSFPSDFKAILKYISKNCYAQKLHHVILLLCVGIIICFIFDNVTLLLLLA